MSELGKYGCPKCGSEKASYLFPIEGKFEEIIPSASGNASAFLPFAFDPPFEEHFYTRCADLRNFICSNCGHNFKMPKLRL